MREQTEAAKAAIKKELENLFTYHAPRPDQLPRYASIRAAGLVFATVIFDNVDKSADRSSALRHVRQAVMEANAGIALEEPPKGVSVTVVSQDVAK